MIGNAIALGCLAASAVQLGTHVIPAPPKPVSFADGKDHDMWPGRCTANWGERCQLDAGHPGPHRHILPELVGFPDTGRTIEWSDR